jgi:hypothetical protein
MVRLLRFSAVRVALLGVAFALVLAASASAATTVTVGEASSSQTYTCGSGWAVQMGAASDVVPAGEWILTSWSTYMGGEVGLMVVQPTGTGGYTVVAESPVETATGGTENTYSVLIAVQPGDLIGVWLPNSGDTYCYSRPGSGNTAAENGVGSGEPTVGSVVTPDYTDTNVRFDLSATLTPYTPSALCAATEAYVNSSAASRTARSSIYSRLDTAQACGALAGRFVNAYDSDVTQLYDNGWLTATQEANLEAAAGYL